MSWSFSAVGKPLAVMQKARKDLSAHKCPEPEETIKGKIVHMLEAALLVYPETVAVQVIASGSQYAPDHRSPNEVINSLSLDIKPLHGFVE